MWKMLKNYQETKGNITTCWIQKMCLKSEPKNRQQWTKMKFNKISKSNNFYSKKLKQDRAYTYSKLQKLPETSILLVYNINVFSLDSLNCNKFKRIGPKHLYHYRWFSWVSFLCTSIIPINISSVKTPTNHNDEIFNHP